MAKMTSRRRQIAGAMTDPDRIISLPLVKDITWRRVIAGGKHDRVGGRGACMRDAHSLVKKNPDHVLGSDPFGAKCATQRSITESKILLREEDDSGESLGY